MKIPTVADLKKEILNDIETATGNPILPRRVWDILAGAMAGSQYLLYRLAHWLHSQIFTSTMDASSLEARGGEYGLIRKPATKYKGIMKVLGDRWRVVPMDSIWEKDGNVYSPYAYIPNVRFQIGSREWMWVTIEAIEFGKLSNLNEGDKLNIISPIVGVESTAVILPVIDPNNEYTKSLFTQGADAEDLEDFRQRIIFRQRNVPQGGSIPDFILWATTVPGISEAFIHRPAPGYVTVYTLTDDEDVTKRIPSADKLTEVSNYINDKRRYPFGREANCSHTMTELEFEVKIANLEPDTPDMKTALKSAIESHLYSRRPRQYDDQIDVFDSISTIELSKIIYDTGASNADVTLKNASKLIVDDKEIAIGTDISAKGYTLRINELAKLKGEIT